MRIAAGLPAIFGGILAALLSIHWLVVFPCRSFPGWVRSRPSRPLGSLTCVRAGPRSCLGLLLVSENGQAQAGHVFLTGEGENER
jgi:hypothetical protein